MFAVPIKSIPNVFVLTDLYNRLTTGASGSGPTAIDSHLARTGIG